MGRSGQAIFGRADMPDDFAYAVAKAMDEKQSLLKWAIRPFSYNVHTVWKNGPVKLHPGAERYYREVGYLKSAAVGLEQQAQVLDQSREKAGGGTNSRYLSSSNRAKCKHV